MLRYRGVLYPVLKHVHEKLVSAFHEIPVKLLLKFLLDESVPRRLALALRELGHSVALVSPGAGNSSVLERCLREGRVLVTTDSNLIFHVLRDARYVERIAVLALFIK